MKRGEIFIQVVSEVSGVPIAKNPRVLEILNQYLPEDGSFEEELTGAVADPMGLG